MSGSLFAVGVGPGDPGLITVRGAELIRNADVIAYYRGTRRPSSVARTTAAGHIKPGVVEEELHFPVTTGDSADYYLRMDIFYDEASARLATHLQAGRDVVLLAEGDALFYGSFMYLHDRLADVYDVHIIPGVTSVQGASASVATGLARHEDVLTVLPATLPVPELARRLADTDAAVIMKLGRTFPRAVEALRQAGMLERALLVQNATSTREKVSRVSDADPDTVPYMSIIIVPGQDRRADAAGRATPVVTPPERHTAGTVHVIGLGPGPDQWLSPEATQTLSLTTHVLGYSPYVARVPQRDGLIRLPSGNTVEVDRAHDALELALEGHDVAVVSGGDAGVFGMASAVFEALEEDQDRYADIDIHVVPGITAAHAAAALAGAFLGGDHALISLSDRLKPWSVIQKRLKACAAADLAIAIYNPRSASRPDQLHDARATLLDVCEPERVVAVARKVGRPGEALEITTLGDLDPETVDMSCLVLIGSSTTRTTSTGPARIKRAWTPRWVEPGPTEP